MIYTWQFILFILYGIPLFFLYTVVIIQLVSLREFKAPFFRLATVLGVTVSFCGNLIGDSFIVSKNIPAYDFLHIISNKKFVFSGSFNVFEYLGSNEATMVSNHWAIFHRPPVSVFSRNCHVSGVLPS